MQKILFILFCFTGSYLYSQENSGTMDTMGREQESYEETDSCKGDTLKHIMFNMRKASEMMYL